MLENYHTHTKRCKHAVGEDREYVEAAIEGGIKILGFSDHCPWIYPDGSESGIRMSPSEVDEYVSSLESLRKEYKDDIEIRIGFESEYIPELMEAQDQFLADYPIDYMLLGQHFLGPETNGGIYMGADIHEVETLISYVDTVIEGMGTGRYRYVAHPDLVHYVGPDDIYCREMRRLCEYLKSIDSPVEINMLGAVQGRHYPDRRFFEIAREVGNRGIIGVDAHEPAMLKDSRGELLCRTIGKGLLEV